jgi:apolipoprotein N-acyltransferase
MFKNNKWNNWLIKIWTILFLFIFAGCQAANITTPPETPNTNVSQVQKEQPPSKTETACSSSKEGSKLFN